MAGTGGIRIGQYRLGKTLGVGSFGKVKLGEHVKTGHKVAVKILNRQKIRSLDMSEKVRREIKILKLFRHPHIIRLYEVIDTPTDIFVVMEYVAQGELFDYIVQRGKLTEDEARRFFQEIISGVEYCHQHMVVHRDLKPENLLIDGDMQAKPSTLQVKIADFGLSNIMRDGEFLKTSCGSPNYAAPEVISGKMYAGPEVDVWSCGVILYALLCGSLPFDDENIPNLFKKIKGGVYNLPNHLSELSRDLIPRMLIVDPLRRITIAEIRKHPWFQCNLAPYLQLGVRHEQLRTVDEEVLAELARLNFPNFDAAEVTRALRRGDRDQLTVAYHLIQDAKFRQKREQINELASATIEEPHAFQPFRLDQCLDCQLAMALRTKMTVNGHATATGNGSPVVSPAHNCQSPSSHNSWILGIQSDLDPSDIMTEIYRVLRAFNFEWKTLSPFRIRCRPVLNSDVASDLKIGIHLYKLSPGRYCVDLQSLEGEALVFMDACVQFICALQLTAESIPPSNQNGGYEHILGINHHLSPPNSRMNRL